MLSAGFIDKIGYRAGAVLAHILIGVGLISLSVLPQCFADPYAGILLSIFFYSLVVNRYAQMGRIIPAGIVGAQ